MQPINNFEIILKNKTTTRDTDALLLEKRSNKILRQGSMQVFKESHGHMLNMLYILEVFFDIHSNVPGFYPESLNKNGLVGFNLLNRLLFNPNFNIKSQAEVDKICQFFKNNLTTFKLFYLLLTDIICNTQANIQDIKTGLPFDYCLNYQLNAFAKIKGGLLQKMSSFKEEFLYEKQQDKSVKKTYTSLGTLNKLLHIIMECNLFIAQERLHMNGNNSNDFVYNSELPELFNVVLLKKMKTPFHIISKEYFEEHYNNMVAENHVTTLEYIVKNNKDITKQQNNHEKSNI